MKCYLCGKGKLEGMQVEHKLYGLVIGKYPAEVCDSCGEVFYDEKASEEIERDTKAKGLYGLSAKARVTQIGDSLGITISKPISRFLKLKKGDTALIRPESGRRIIIELTD
ncbi:YgiT-type zinc finger protein [Candidatus Woesearchaeota archaeon]|nr:YgiT-type zinc finger protein [Candidatus Woesearchaeota archaeon]